MKTSNPNQWIKRVKYAGKLEREELLGTFYKNLSGVFVGTMLRSFGSHSNEAFRINEVQAMDVLHKSFLKFYEQIFTQSDLEITSKLSAYLIGMGKNLWRQEAEKRIKDAIRLAQMQKDQENLLEDSESITPDPIQQAAERDERDENLVHTLSKLEAKCQRIIELFFFEGWRSREVAQRLNRNEATVRQNKKRCLTQLRKKLVLIMERKGL